MKTYYVIRILSLPTIFIQIKISFTSVALVDDYKDGCIFSAIENGFDPIVDGPIVLAPILEDQQIKATFREKESVSAVGTHLSGEIPNVQCYAATT